MATGNPNIDRIGVSWPTDGNAGQYLGIDIPSVAKTGFSAVTTKQMPR